MSASITAGSRSDANGIDAFGSFCSRDFMHEPKPLRRRSHLEGAAGPYPERAEPDPFWLDRRLSDAYGNLAVRLLPNRARLLRQAGRAQAEARAIGGLSDGRLRERADALRELLLHHGLADPIVAQVFAVVREAAGRCTGLWHYPVQLMGGQALLDGTLAEMETGEGKTLTALLPAVAAALAGLPVHIITVNEYLAGRDAEQLRPVYEALGLSVGLAVHGQTPAERRAAYACNVTYCTNKEIVFDYLRDRLALGRRRTRSRLLLDELLGGGDASEKLLLRGLHFAIVDEADSVLIDEARTPLILSAGEDGESAATLYETALAFARQLSATEHFGILPGERRSRLTTEGHNRLAELARDQAGLWQSRRARAELVEHALSALHLYRRDTHYLVADGKIQIVDEFTGRVMPDRSWERGLHQMIEAKEGCELTGRRPALARITYQRFFRRYLRLAGMTGTAREAAGELWAVFALRTVRIPTNRPLCRSNLGTCVYTTAAQKWQRVLQCAAKMTVVGGRSVLIGTRSVAASEHLSRLLGDAGLDHVVLNARQDQAEAQIIAAAGQRGRITVATNMAGRGTDIPLSPEVRRAGGLHVVLTEFHEARRIDRQLFGRCGRQGDPGSFEAIVSLEDELFQRFAGSRARHIAALLARKQRGLAPPIAGPLRWHTQAVAERLHSKIRRDMVAQDKRLDKALAFAGQSE
jgi:preprotein translocase subunit SecA